MIGAMQLSAAEKKRICDAARRLREAERPVRVLRSVAWSPEHRERFLARGAHRMPQVEYPRFDPGPTLAALAELRVDVSGDGPVDAWLLRQAQAIEDAAHMLAGIGTPAFFRHSSRLYGTPTSTLADAATTSLQLAEQLEATLGALAGVDLGAPPEPRLPADEVAEWLREAVAGHFGADAPEVVVVDQLSADALAGPRAIRLRRGARFTDRYVAQLVHHEAHVHVATSLNGSAQRDLPLLAASHPGTTRTQEGLAVFAEFISGAMDVDRLGRLVARVRAIQMAIEGADFLEVYRFFLGRDIPPESSFESARRVFRGGVLGGGAPFTKDVVYLDGLLRVHNFLRAAVASGRSDCLRVLFCGKLDVDDVPALCVLANAGLCRPARFLPPWARDLRFLLAYLAYSSFLNRVDLARIREHFDAVIGQAPRVAAKPA